MRARVHPEDVHRQLGFNCGPTGDGCGHELQCGRASRPRRAGAAARRASAAARRRSDRAALTRGDRRGAVALPAIHNLLQVVVEERLAVPRVAVDELTGLGRDLGELGAEPGGAAWSSDCSRDHFTTAFASNS